MSLAPEEKKIWEDRVSLWSTSVYDFAMDVFPHFLFKSVAPFHKDIYRELPLHPYLAIEAFRGSAKSTINLIIYPIWHSIFRKAGDISLLSKSEEFVVNEIARKIKAEFENNTYLQMLGVGPTKKWSETYFVINNGIAFESGGISGQLRGGRRGLIALDDLEDEETAISEDQRDKLRRRINKELIPKLLPNSQMVYLGTPVHMLCYLRQLLETPDNGWHKMRYPAYKDNMEEEGHETWADMFPHSRLQEMKKIMGSNAFAAEMLCNPLSSADIPIKEKHLRYWTELPKQYSCVIAVDPAYSEDENADYKTASVIAIDQNNNRYLIDYVRNHAPTGEFIDAILNLYLRYKGIITGVGLPKGGGDREFFSSFLKKLDERRLQEVPIQELKNTMRSATGQSVRNKKARITASLQHLFEQGKYYIHANHTEARDEILTIGQSKHDDIVDTMAYAEQILQPVYFDTNQHEKDFEEEAATAFHGDTGYGI